MQHLFAEHHFTAGSSQSCKAWKALTASLRDCQDPNGTLVYRVQGICENGSKKGIGGDIHCNFLVCNSTSLVTTGI